MGYRDVSPAEAARRKGKFGKPKRGGTRIFGDGNESFVDEDAIIKRNQSSSENESEIDSGSGSEEEDDEKESEQEEREQINKKQQQKDKERLELVRAAREAAKAEREKRN